ncbi:MAG TPA: EutN/CcmL family microcompartment protein [Elusimicrobiota bacterium]|nr:EutN/CcmL family microcompartment protein [Elusimicrobiota bacterium]
MFIAKVIGSVWCTKQHDALNRKKLMLVQPVDFMGGRAIGDPVMAVDVKMGAGPGDTVLVMDEGNSARIILQDKKAPVRTVICGVVDSVTVRGKTYKFH